MKYRNLGYLEYLTYCVRVLERINSCKSMYVDVTSRFNLYLVNKLKSRRVGVDNTSTYSLVRKPRAEVTPATEALIITDLNTYVLYE